MKIVIDIPEDKYKKIIDKYDTFPSEMREWGLASIKNGTPLLKEHGRLISADSLIKAIEEKAKRLSNLDTINGLCGAVALIFEAPTVIEANKRRKLK